MRALPAETKGTSSRLHDSAEETVEMNKAGPDYSTISFDSMVQLFFAR